MKTLGAMLVIVVGLLFLMSTLELRSRLKRDVAAATNADSHTKTPSIQEVQRFLLYQDLNRRLPQSGFDAQVIQVGSDKFAICGPGINRVTASAIMSARGLKQSLQASRIEHVDFHTSCDLVSPSNFDRDHYIASYDIPLPATKKDAVANATR